MSWTVASYRVPKNGCEGDYVDGTLNVSGERFQNNSVSVTGFTNRELKHLRRRQPPKKSWFNGQNNSSARASLFLVHFFDVHYTTTT